MPTLTSGSSVGTQARCIAGSWCGALVAAGLLLASSSSAQECETVLASSTSSGAQVSYPGPDGFAVMSGDTRYVIFATGSFTVVPGDTNGWGDVFRVDRQSGSVRRINLGPGGVQTNAGSRVAGISGDGRYALVFSFASNLVPGDVNGDSDLFRIDCVTNEVACVDVNASGQPSVGGATYGDISRNGRYVAFTSFASDLVAGDTNGVGDVFLRDMLTGVTTRVSVDSTGAQANAASGQLSAGVSGPQFSPRISEDGRWIVFTSLATNLVAGDTNGGADVFLHDAVTHVTERVSVASGGVELLSDVSTRAVVSADGRFIAFIVEEPNGGPPPTLGGGIYVHDRSSGSTILVNGSASTMPNPAIAVMSPDAQFVAYTLQSQGILQSWMTNVRTGSARLVSVDMQGQAAGDESFTLDISDDGTAVLFQSVAATLVPSDTNTAPDLFLRSCRAESERSFCPGLSWNCPCGNGGIGSGGCENSQATGGAKLRASGPPSVTGDAFSLIVTDATATTSVLFFQGDAQLGGGAGVPFGSGAACVGGNVRRLGVRTSENGTAWYGHLGADVPVSVQGGIPSAGGRRYYQALYRDALSTCGGTSNASNGISVQWTP